MHRLNQTSLPSPTASDPRYLRQGRRLIGWLSGRTRYLWPRDTVGAWCARIARATGATGWQAWPGPLPARDARYAPPLSWFCLPLTATGCDPVATAMNQWFGSGATDFDAAEADRLMRRMLTSDALHLRQRAATLPPALAKGGPAQRILLIDEREKSMAGPRERSTARVDAFRSMVDAARRAHPDAELWLGPTSDAGQGRWLSHASRAISSDLPRLPPSYSLTAALEHFDRVYVVSASEGFGALLAGVPLHVFGRPYYAGWGLTDDNVPFASRTARPTLPLLFHAAFLRFSRYLDTLPGQTGTLDSALDAIELQHDVRARFADLNDVCGLRFQWWKRRLATPYLTAGGGTLRWSKSPERLRAGESAVLWGARPADGIPGNVKRHRIEDGFIHSAGLGSDMTPPYSQVIDHSGLYFDPSVPSDLTQILNESPFGNTELARAAALRETIVRLGITKYNLGRRRPEWQAPRDRRVVLVPGQVADDASIRLGTRAINTAEGLLAEVRAQRPDAFIVYKPHPDVLSGNRVGAIDIDGHADVIDVTSDIVSLIEQADEVHTLSSLSGFDALLRNKAVFTYGLPFYAGWGLTNDAISPQPWRKRSLTLDMLVAGTLLRYPIYWHWQTKLYTTPEAVALQLAPLIERPLISAGKNRQRTALKIFRWCYNAFSHIHWRLVRTTQSRTGYHDP